MERKQFLRCMALALQATVQKSVKLSLPLRVILFGTAPQVIYQFQTFVRREAVHRPFKFCNARALNSLCAEGISRARGYPKRGWRCGEGVPA